MKNIDRKKAYFCFKSGNDNEYVYDASTNMIYPDVSGFSKIVEKYYHTSREQVISELGIIHGGDNVSMTFDYIDSLVKNHQANNK